MKAYIITKDNKDTFVIHADSMDNAIKKLGLGFSSISSQYIPELNDLQVIKNNPKNIRIKFNGKEHLLTTYKDAPNTYMACKVTKLDNGQEWFSYASDVQDTLNAYYKKIYGKESYTWTLKMIEAIYKGIKLA